MAENMFRPTLDLMCLQVQTIMAFLSLATAAPCPLLAFEQCAPLLGSAAPFFENNTPPLDISDGHGGVLATYYYRLRLLHEHTPEYEGAGTITEPPPSARRGRGAWGGQELWPQPVPACASSASLVLPGRHARARLGANPQDARARPSTPAPPMIRREAFLKGKPLRSSLN